MTLFGDEPIVDDPSPLRFQENFHNFAPSFRANSSFHERSILRQSFPFGVSSDYDSNINTGVERLVHVMKRTFKVIVILLAHSMLFNCLHS
jgi:hypothetical protein